MCKIFMSTFDLAHNVVIHCPSPHRDQHWIKDRLKKYVLGLKSRSWLPIQFDVRGQPVGDNSFSLTSFMDTRVRRGNIICIIVLDWRRISEIARDRAWEQINVNKLFPIVQFLILHCVGKLLSLLML